jgi:hypothetical protein
VGRRVTVHADRYRSNPECDSDLDHPVRRRPTHRGAGLPRGAKVDPATGELINNTGFLHAERYLLQDRGWSYDPKLSLWLPPGW